MTSPKAMQAYYDVDGSPVAWKGIQKKKIQHLQRFLNQHLRINIMFDWANTGSEEDFFNLSAGYLMDKNLKKYGKQSEAAHENEGCYKPLDKKWYGDP